jgi:DNA ligase 1
MPDIEDGDSVEVQGSAKDPYILKNVGGVYSCTCPAWRNQSMGLEQRTCKHLRAYRGDAAESERLGSLPERSARAPRPKSSTAGAGTVLSGTADGASATATVPPILLAHSWTSDVDPEGWWISEKLDGVRAYWDGEQFISRQGNVYMAPDWFVEGLPKDIHLDGELWLARKAFQRAVSIVRRQDRNAQWKEITYVIFDAPNHGGTFEERIAFVKQKLDESKPAYARSHDHTPCESRDHLKAELARIEEAGGEGLMLRKPASRYESGRSFTLLKVKTFHDAEARVIGHLPGTGKHKGRLGALSVELPNGAKFSVGTGFSDRERENPPPIGSIIMFSYQELSDGGIPRFPAFVRVRTDVDSFQTNLELKPAAAAISTANERVFVYAQEGSTSTWTIRIEGTTVHTRFLRDQNSETSSKSFPTQAAAQANLERQVAQKIRAGFKEQ